VIEDLVLEPVAGEFDVDAIAAYLDAQATAARDPQESRRFLLSSKPETLVDAIDKRRAGDPSISLRVAIVFPVAARILVGFRTRDTAPVRVFLEWLGARQPIKILDEDGNDFTDRGLDYLFT
jgi:hypothetical protein